MRPTVSDPREKPRTELTTFSHAVIHLLVQKRAGELQHLHCILPQRGTQVWTCKPLITYNSSNYGFCN